MASLLLMFILWLAVKGQLAELAQLILVTQQKTAETGQDEAK